VEVLVNFRKWDDGFSYTALAFFLGHLVYWVLCTFICRSYDNQEEQLMPEDSHVRRSESPESTHLWKRRFVVLFVFKCIVHAGPIRVEHDI
jgi:hypothetical protein